MPRQKRVEFAGAIYHVINRGNYRSGIFEQGRSGEVFEELLFESCERFNWELYGYCILGNHYHLALKTREGNLSVGMQWLQSVFGNRFNRYVKTPGHVFQGRYKSPLVEAGPSLLRVVNYIHLNPVAAGIVPLEKLDSYPLSSFPKFLRKKRPEFMNWDWLEEAAFECGLAGMRRYWSYLETIREEDPKKRVAIERSLCRGWYVGSPEGKKALLKELRDDHGLAEPGLAVLEPQEHAQALLESGLNIIGQDRESLKSSPKSCFWKASLCRLLHKRTGVSNKWLAAHLHLGHPNAVSRIRQRPPLTKEDRKLEKQLQKMTIDFE